MDLTWTAEELAFRDEVREFVKTQIPEDMRAKTFAHQRASREDYIRWHKILANRGWGHLTGPKNTAGPVGPVYRK